MCGSLEQVKWDVTYLLTFPIKRVSYGRQELKNSHMQLRTHSIDKLQILNTRHSNLELKQRTARIEFFSGFF